jgi:RNA polymerase sigma factor (sigma-70 family)
LTSAPLPQYSDAELVAGVLAGDRDSFAAIYDRYANRLHDFCFSVLRDRDEAADAVQDTFLLAVKRLGQVNDPDRLRPWLYAVARSVALRRLRARRRVVLDEVGEDLVDSGPGPDRAAEREALRDLVWAAAAGLSERDRVLLDLHVRQGLDGAELGTAMGVPTGHAHVLLTRLRDQVERSLGALLIARLGRADCAGLDTMLAGWDGKFSPLLRKRVARHVDSCEVCGDRRRIMVSPFALLATVPLVAAPLLLRDRVLDDVELVAHASPPDAVAAPVTRAVAAVPAKRRRARVLAAAAAVVAVLAILGAVVWWSASPVRDDPVALEIPATTSTEPAVTSTRPPSSSTPPPPPTTTTVVTTTTRPPTTTTTTTTTRPPQPPPPPPASPDPPKDTTLPVVSAASASQPRIFVADCIRLVQTSPVSATVSDDRGVESVRLSWDGPDGAGGAAMSAADGQWSGALGPFDRSGKVSWSVTATDAAGNVSAPMGGDITVSGCVIG